MTHPAGFLVYNTCVYDAIASRAASLVGFLGARAPSPPRALAQTRSMADASVR